MRRLITWNVLTLDGFFEGAKKWDLSFHDLVWGEELERFSIEQSREVGALVFGRVTYEGMAAHWSTAQGEIADFMNGIPKVVFSRTLERADWSNTTLVKEDAAEQVPRLKAQSGKPLFIFGSADLCASLMRHRLIDEFRIAIAPVVLGKGNTFFKGGDERTKLKLLQAEPLRVGGVMLRYELP